MADPYTDHWRATWVPADRRRFGLDRRTLLPAGLVALLFAVANWVLPGVDAAVKVSDPIRPGDVVQVGETVQFVPATGSDLLAGQRRGDPTVTGYAGTAAVSYQGTVFRITADTYRGTPAQLLEQIRRTDEGTRAPGDKGVHVTGDPIAITNADGDRGVAAHVDGANAVGLLAAFVFGETGVEIQIVGPQTVSDSVSREVGAMLASVRPVEGA